MKTNEKNNIKSKDKIIEAAKKLFLTQGYAKTTTREIAKEADENLGLIVYYFKTKDKLALQIYQTLLDELYENMNYEHIEYKNSIEELFLSATYAQKELMENDALLKFFWELMLSDIVPTDAHKYTVSLVEKIIDEFELDVSKDDSYKYSVIAKGAEKVLTQKKLKNEMSITFMEINTLTLTTAMLHLGLSMNVIDGALEACMKRLDQRTIETLNT